MIELLIMSVWQRQNFINDQLMLCAEKMHYTVLNDRLPHVIIEKKKHINICYKNTETLYKVT